MMQRYDKFDWCRFAGREINILIPGYEFFDVFEGILRKVPEFEAETGIKVHLERMYTTEYIKHINEDLRLERGDVDVYFHTLDFDAFTHYKRGWVKSLTPFLRDPSMTAPDFDFADFFPQFVAAAEYPKGSGTYFSLPFLFESYIIAYHRGHVDKYLGGHLPQTMDALIEAAKRITVESNGQVYGMLTRGVHKASIMDPVTAVAFNAYGEGDVFLPFNLWFDGDWSRPRLDHPGITKGLRQYAALMSAGPRNVKQVDWRTILPMFEWGHGCFFLDASQFTVHFEKPSSPLAGNTGYMVLPPNDANGSSYTGHWMIGVGIPENALHPEAAFYFLQWITSKRIEAEVAVFHAGAVRRSSWENETYVRHLNPEYVSAVLDSIRLSRSTTVFHHQWGAMALEILTAIHKIYDGDPFRAARTAQEGLKALAESKGHRP